MSYAPTKTDWQSHVIGIHLSKEIPDGQESEVLTSEVLQSKIFPRQIDQGRTSQSACAQDQSGPTSPLKYRRRTFRTTWWSSCATRRRSRSPPRGSPRPAAAAPQADSLNSMLARFDIAAMRSQFGLPASAIRSRVEVAATLPPEPDPKRFAKKGMDTEFIQSGFVQVVPKSSARREEDRDARSTDRSPSGKRMSRRVRCRRCLPGRRPAAATSSRRRAISMTRRTASAPWRYGVSPAPKAKASRSATSKATGIARTKICRRASRSSAARVIADLGWRNHGTAVLGEMVSIPDAQGLRRHQPSGQGRRPVGRHQRRLQHRRSDHQRGQPA